MHDVISTTETGLIYESASGRSSSVPWEQIASLVVNCKRRRYNLLNTHGQHLMHISFDLKNFGQLDEQLREHLASKYPDTFIIFSNGGKILLALCFFPIAGFLHLFWVYGINISLFVFVLAYALLVVGYSFYGLVEQVQITHEGVLINYWKRQVLIPFNAIQGVVIRKRLVVVDNRNVCIHRVGQRTLKIPYDSVHAPMLHKAVEAAWKRAVPQANVSRTH